MLHRYHILLIIASILTSCAREKIIDIEEGTLPAKLSVTAILDTDSGQFYLSVYRFRPLSGFIPFNEEVPEWRDGTVRLYEDGKLILNLSRSFDLAWKDKDGSFLYQEHVPAKSGSTYYLEIEVEGYDPVSATAIMPEAPDIKSITIDTTKRIINPRTKDFGSVGESSGRNYGTFCPLNIFMGNNTNNLEYHTIQSIEDFVMNGYRDEPNGYKSYDGRVISIGTDQFDLIRDTPEVEAEEDFLSSDTYDMCSFSILYLSNLSFPAETGSIRLYTGFQRTNKLSKFTGREIECHYKRDLILKHITRETFQYYRGITLQLQKMDFFHQEPVFIQSNIVNGYGSFSVCNSVRYTILDYISYYYPDMSPPVGP